MNVARGGKHSEHKADRKVQIRGEEKRKQHKNKLLMNFFKAKNVVN
jgi:hypothetical protein